MKKFDEFINENDDFYFDYREAYRDLVHDKLKEVGFDKYCEANEIPTGVNFIFRCFFNNVNISNIDDLKSYYEKSIEAINFVVSFLKEKNINYNVNQGDTYVYINIDFKENGTNDPEVLRYMKSKKGIDKYEL